MSNLKGGGPAFPIPMNPGESYQGHAPCDGMTLRDYFAAKALAGLLSLGSLRGYSAKALAREAYRYADAMLEASNA